MPFENMYSRSAPLDKSIIEEKTRSIRTVIASDNPVLVMDWERWQTIREVLRMDGVLYPESGQVVLLNNHSRWEGTSAVKGSVREIEVKGPELVGRTYFASTKDVEDDWTKAREGHLTDVSAGYRTFKDKTTIIKPGETAVVSGQTYRNDYGDGIDLVIRTQWQLKEVSLTPIGADEIAKFRSQQNIFNSQNREGVNMPAPKQEPENKGTRQQPSQPEPVPAVIQLDAHNREVEEARAEGARLEIERQKEIRACLDLAILPDKVRSELAENLVSDPKITVDAARKSILEAQAKPGLQSVKPGERNVIAEKENNGVRVDNDETDKFRSGCIDAILVSTGIENDPKKVSDVGRSELPQTIHGLIKNCLLREDPNKAQRIVNMDSDTLAREATRLFHRAYPVSSGDFSAILMDAMNKVIGTAFSREMTTYQLWCASGSAKDFKSINIISKGAFSDWEKILDGAPIPYGKFSDKYETASIDTYGKALAMPRKAIINDDMNFFTDLLQMVGQGAARSVDDLVYETMVGTSLAGPTITETGGALFNSTAVTSSGGHYNLIASSGIVSHATLNTAQLRLRTRPKLSPDKKSKTRYAGASMRFLVTGVNNEMAIRQLLSSQYDNTATGSLAANMWTNGSIIPVFSETLQYYIDLQSKSSAWYGIADPNSGYTLCKVFFLNGQRMPTLRRSESSVGEPLGIVMDGYFDFGVAFPEWRAAVCNDGA